MSVVRVHVGELSQRTGEVLPKKGFELPGGVNATPIGAAAYLQHLREQANSVPPFPAPSRPVPRSQGTGTAQGWRSTGPPPVGVSTVRGRSAALIAAHTWDVRRIHRPV